MATQINITRRNRRPGPRGAAGRGPRRSPARRRSRPGRRAAGLQRDAPRAARRSPSAAPAPSDVVEAVRFARSHDLTACGARRRALDRRPVDHRRGHAPGPVAHVERARRPRAARGPCPGRRAAGRRRPRDAAVRARRPARPGLGDRRRRPQPRRRLRLAAAQARPRLRQHRRRAGRLRRRRGPHGLRGGQPRPAVGAARRWRQLRRRHVARLPPAPGRPGGRLRGHLLPGRGDRRRACAAGAATSPRRPTR